MRRSSPAIPALPLFPFQAVLCATMGALILVLVVVNRNSRSSAAMPTVAETQPASDSDEARAQRESVQWRIEQLQQSREKTAEQLADDRLRLSGAEEHLRQMREQWQHLTATAEQLKAASGAQPDQAAAAELARLQGLIAQSQQDLDETKRQVSERSRSFAIIPYFGPNQTRRRPIYIECRADEVILQPEGIVLKPSDFEGPPGPGNPLAAALRAAREHISQVDRTHVEKASEPYPLLLVRPDGILAYYIARNAMSSWGAEFGYEFIGDDWKLAFPPVDPQLAQVEQQAVSEARARIQYAVALTRGDGTGYGAGTGTGGSGSGSGGSGSSGSGNGYGGAGIGGGNSPRPKYRVSQGPAGIVREDGPSLDDDDGDDAGLGKSSGRRWGSGNSSGGSSPGGGNPGGGNLVGGGPSGSNPTGSGPGGSGTGLLGGGPGGSGPNGSGPGGNDLANGTGTPGGAVNSGAGPALGSGSAPGGGPAFPGDPLAGSPMPGGAGSTGDTTSPGGSGPRTVPTGGDGSGQPGLTGNTFLDTPPAGSTDSPPPRKLKSLAASRGQDWGLPGARSKLTAVRRPIRIECCGDHLTIKPEFGEGGRVIPLQPRTEDSVDDLVVAVRDVMKGWGIAGHAMYWRPALVLEIGPSGEGRFYELQSLLENSGFDVRRKEG